MEKLWFKSKSFGWGWQPATKEGWMITLLFMAAAIYVATNFQDSTSKLLGSLILLTGIFILIAYKTGEKPKWSWSVKKK